MTRGPEQPGTLARLLTMLPGIHWAPSTHAPPTVNAAEDDRPPLQVARAELVLARDPRFALARLDIKDHDPLHEIASALAGLSHTGGREQFELHLDLLPISPGQQQTIKNKIVAQDAAKQNAPASSGGGLRDQLRIVTHGIDAASPRATQGRPSPQQRRTALERAAVNRETRDLGAKVLAVDEAWWELQLLLVARSVNQTRADERLRMVIAALQQFGDENRLRVSGPRIGPLFFGSDMPGRRQRFDRRVDTGLFRPAKSGWVSTGEVAAFLKPPTANLQITNIARGGGTVPSPPKTLPTYRGPQDKHLLPQGWVRDEHGWRPVGVPLADTFFELLTGKSRSGKSERMLTQFIHLALAGHGGMYLDPHVQAIERMKPYLGPIADRILEFNLSRTHAGRQAGFNLLSMSGRTRADIEGRIGAVVSAFSAALSWSSINNRAQNLLTQSVWSLCEIGLKLPADLQPTIFQITTILSDEEWRAAVLPHLPKDVAAFWLTRFGNLEKSAITPVTNLLDRLRSSPSVAALLGTSQSTFDMRRAMDDGAVILASPAGTGDKDKFLAAFFLYDVFLAALSRQDSGLSMDQLRPFHLAVDEMQIYDTAGSVLELMLRETAKYGLKVFGATQSLTVLQKATQDMWLTNRSHIISSAERAEAARILSKEMGDLVEPRTFTRLERFTSIGQVTLAHKTSTPFWMRGFDSTDVFAEFHDPKAEATIAAAVDKNLGRRPVDQTLEELRSLDDRIALYLSTHVPRVRTEINASRPTSSPTTSTTTAPAMTDESDEDNADEQNPHGDNVVPLRPRSKKPTPTDMPPPTRWE